MIKIILALLTLLYPFVVFYGLAEFSVRWVSFTLILLFLMRSLALKKANTNNPSKLISPFATTAISLLMLALLLFSFVFDADVGLLFYPVIINGALATVFLYSLFNPPPVIERLARLAQPELPLHAIAYTRTVTKVWIVFFLLNGFVATYTALFTSLQTWTLYNGFVAYIAMAVLFAGEYLVRLRVQKFNEN